jgi:hypothetical protein
MRVRELLDFHRRLFPTWDTLLKRAFLDVALAGYRTEIGAFSKG